MPNKSSSMGTDLGYLGNRIVKNGTCVLIAVRLHTKYGDRKMLALLN